MAEELTELGEFTGTEHYYKGWLGVLYTDGVQYLTAMGYSWFVTDAVSVIKTELKDEEFLCIMLKLNGSKGEMVITDGNDKILYSQKYEYTDAKQELKLFCQNNVIMLAREY